MKVQIVKFYTFYRDDNKRALEGTMHISLPELGFEVKGCIIRKDRDTLYVAVPQMKSFNKELNRFVSFPMLCFSDMDVNREFVKEFRIEASLFVHNLLEQRQDAITDLRKPSKKPVCRKELTRNRSNEQK